jgi:hypothetical protein
MRPIGSRCGRHSFATPASAIESSVRARSSIPSELAFEDLWHSLLADNHGHSTRHQPSARGRRRGWWRAGPVPRPSRRERVNAPTAVVRVQRRHHEVAREHSPALRCPRFRGRGSSADHHHIGPSIGPVAGIARSPRNEGLIRLCCSPASAPMPGRL